MGVRTRVAFNIDKVKTCYNIPKNCISTLMNSMSGGEIYYEGASIFYLDEQREEDDTITRLSLGINFDDTYLGQLDIHESGQYRGRAFFNYDNLALYKVANDYMGCKSNYLTYADEIIESLGLRFNNITLLEIACDTNINFISKVKKMIKNTADYDLYLNGKKVIDSRKTLDEYGEYFSRSREQMSRQPTLYLSQKKDTGIKMRIYNKTRELNEASPEKKADFLLWSNFEDYAGDIYRCEISIRNEDIRDFVKRCHREPYSEHGYVLHSLTDEAFRTLLWSESADSLIYFRDKRTNEKTTLASVIEL